MIVRNHNDIEKYTDSRFQVARTVAGSVLDLVLSKPNDGGLEIENLTLLLNFLHHTRLTSVFEILQPHYQVTFDLAHFLITVSGLHWSRINHYKMNQEIFDKQNYTIKT